MGPAIPGPEAMIKRIDHRDQQDFYYLLSGLPYSCRLPT